MDKTLHAPVAPSHSDQKTVSTSIQVATRLPWWTGDAAALATLLAGLLVVCRIALQGGRGLYRLDVITFYLPWYSHLGERLRDLDIPGWLPYTMSGVPFAGDPQSGWGYLPAMVIFTIAPSVTGFKLFVAFHILLAGLSTYALARAVGLNALGALTAAIGFALGNFLQRTVCCTIHMQVAVWVPLAILGIEMGMRTERWTTRLRWLVLTGFACSQILAGWIGQGGYYGMLAVGAYLAFRTLASREHAVNWWRRPRDLLIAGAVILAITLPLAAPALMPRLDVISRSNLSDLYEEGDAATDENKGWTLVRLADRLFTEQTRSGHFYIGIALLVAAMAAPWIVGRRHRAFYFAGYGIALLSIIMRWRPLGDLLGILPRFDDLHRHLPDRALVVIYVAPALLAGALVHTVTSRDHVRLKAWRVAGAVLTPMAVLAAVEVLLRTADDSNRDTKLTLSQSAFVTAGIVLLAVVAAILARPRSVRVLAALAILLTLVADPTGRFLNELTSDPEFDDLVQDRVTAFTEPNGAARWLQARTDAGERFRYYGYNPALLVNQDEKRTYHVTYQYPETQSILVNNMSVGFELQDVQGYNPVQIARYVNWFEAINADDQSYHAANVLFGGWDSPLLDMLNVRYVVIPGGLAVRDPEDGDVVDDPVTGEPTWVQTVPAGRPDLLHLSQRLPTVYADDTNRILESPTALPRAWIVHDADKVQSTEQLAKWQLRLVDPTTTALTENTIDLEALPGGQSESVTITSYAPDEIRLRVETGSRGLVVLSEIWDPGWEASVGGEERRVYRVNYTMRGVLVDAGVSEVVLHFDPPVLRQSMLIAVGGIGLAGGILAATWVWDRRRTSPLATVSRPTYVPVQEPS